MTPQNMFIANNNKTKIQTHMEKKQVLIVSDTDDFRKVLKTALDTNYTILESNNGKTAFEVLEKNNNIDIIITDIDMPIMNGYDLIKTIRKNNKYNKKVILVCTQFGFSDQEEGFLEIGANDFIYKTSSLKSIERRVKNTLPSA